MEVIYLTKVLSADYSALLFSNLKDLLDVMNETMGTICVCSPVLLTLAPGSTGNAGEALYKNTTGISG